MNGGIVLDHDCVDHMAKLQDALLDDKTPTELGFIGRLWAAIWGLA